MGDGSGLSIFIAVECLVAVSVVSVERGSGGEWSESYQSSMVRKYAAMLVSDKYCPHPGISEIPTIRRM